nr:retrovirus-related Pol polyprotein from transposon TNT 1-94 [Tanacetum cinerariifolium]
MKSLSPQVVSAAKLPVLNPNEFDLWKMRIEQYFLMTNYSLWEVIHNGDSPFSTRVIEGVVQPLAPTTTEQRLTRKNELKARGTLLMALPDKHQLKFNTHKDAKTLMAAIKKRFGGNQETKKVQKTLLKQQYENFTGSSFESLDQIHDRLNKTDLKDKSLDDLFNSLKIYEAEVKSSSSASTSTQNIAFVSSQNTNGTNESVSAVASVSAASAKVLVYALPNVDTLNADDLEEMDLKWQMVMLTMRARRFLQKTGRNTGANGNTYIGFDISKVECYNYHRRRHFAREYMSAKDTRRNVLVETQRRNVPVETSTSESDVSMLASLVYDRYKLGDGYHTVPPPYTGTFMPPKPDLVFHNALTVNEIVHTAFNVELSPTKPDKDLSHSHRPSAPIIEDWVSDSEDESEAEPTQNAPSFVQPPKHVKSPRPSVKPAKHTILTLGKTVPHQGQPKLLSPSHIYHQKRTINRSSSPKPSNFPPTVTTVKAPKGNPQHALKEKGVINSRCSRHMTGNMSYLSDFEAINGGYVAFSGNPKGGKIIGKGKIRTCKLDFDDVYFVKELKFNLFSVLQMCDKKNSVLFIDIECIVLSSDFKLPDDNHVLLRVPRENNMYNVDLKNIVPSRDLTCLFAKATLDEMKGIKREFSVARTPQQNGIAKKKNKTLIEAARTMLADSLLPIPFWAETVNTACYVQNRVLVTKPHNKTPYELLHGRTPSIGFMIPFGCHVTILNTLDPLGKFDGKADEGFLAGYSLSSKAFRVFNSRTRIVQETLHINFLENKPNVVISGPTWLYDIDTLTKSMNYQPVTAGNQPNPSANPQNTDDDTAFEVKEPEFEGKKPESEVHVSLSSSAKTKKHDDKTTKEAKGKSPVEFTNTFSATGPSNTDVSPTLEKSSYVDPSQYHDDPNMPALEDISYSDDEEDVGAEADFTNLESTITVSPIPTTRVHKDHPVTQIIGNLTSATETRSMTRMVKDQGTKWVFRNKKDERGIVVRNKARLVAQGHTQEEGIYYEEIFAPVARIEAIRLFLAYASFMGFMVYQMNVKSAFLYGTIKEEVYVCQPPGFEDPGYPNKVYKVVKALYELHQAPRGWYKTLANYLLENGFQRGKIDQTLFIKKQKGDIVLVQVYVDDISFGSTNKDLCKAFEKKLDGIFISQDKYVAKILRKFGLTDGKSTSTPIDTKKPLLKDPDGEDMDVHTYRSMIGSLMYLTSSRPDILFAVYACARFRVIPKASHLHAVNLIRNVDSSYKFYMYPRFLQLIIRAQVGDLSSHTTKYSSPALTQKVFANMRRMEKGFSKVETPLFEGTLVPQQDAANVANIAVDDVDD